MFFVTFHQTISNVYAYQDHGTTIAPGILNAPGQNLDELRGIYFLNGYLYVVNGGKKTSSVLCFQGSGTSYSYVSTFISSGGPIDHPFALAFDGQGHCYVSNQDTNVVATLNMNGATQASLASSVSPFLHAIYPQGTFLPATLVASSVGSLPNVGTTTPVPMVLGGLDVSIQKKKVQNSVRDVAYLNGLLYVLDEPGGFVRIYNPTTGQPLINSNPINSPTHLLVHGSTIYVAAGNQVLSSNIPNPYDPNAAAWVFEPVLTLGSSDSASGMAFDSSGSFYVADRSTNTVYVYDQDFKLSYAWPAMQDNPEFLLYMGG